MHVSQRSLERFSSPEVIHSSLVEEQTTRHYLRQSTRILANLELSMPRPSIRQRSRKQTGREYTIRSTSGGRIRSDLRGNVHGSLTEIMPQLTCRRRHRKRFKISIRSIRIRRKSSRPNPQIASNRFEPFRAFRKFRNFELFEHFKRSNFRASELFSSVQFHDSVLIGSSKKFDRTSRTFEQKKVRKIEMFDRTCRTSLFDCSKLFDRFEPNFELFLSMSSDTFSKERSEAVLRETQGRPSQLQAQLPPG